jgi:ClpP class serine protease
MHEDISGMLEEQGVAVTMIAVPRFKTEANPFQPLTKQAMAHHTQQVEASYEQFVADVARGRGVAKSVVKQGYGEGRVFHASQAAEMGLVDRVASLDRLMQELGSSSKSEISRQESSRVAQELCHAWETGESGVMPNMDVQAREDRMRVLMKQ